MNDVLSLSHCAAQEYPVPVGIPFGRKKTEVRFPMACEGLADGFPWDFKLTHPITPSDTGWGGCIHECVDR